MKGRKCRVINMNRVLRAKEDMGTPFWKPPLKSHLSPYLPHTRHFLLMSSPFFHSGVSLHWWLNLTSNLSLVLLYKNTMFVQNYRKMINLKLNIWHNDPSLLDPVVCIVTIKAKYNHQNKNTVSPISRILPSKSAFLVLLFLFVLFCLGGLLVSLKHPLEETNPVHDESCAQLL